MERGRASEKGEGFKKIFFGTEKLRYRVRVIVNEELKESV